MGRINYSREALDELRLRAKEMRRNPTKAEALMWEELRAHRLDNLKFRRQHLIAPYIVDFYCAACSLVIEIDGGVHDDRKTYDQSRTDYLESLGYCVLRFTNEEVVEDISMVLGKVIDACFS